MVASRVYDRNYILGGSNKNQEVGCPNIYHVAFYVAPYFRVRSGFFPD